MQQKNPLESFFRKPQFQISLPSRGSWYPSGALDSATGDVDVYAMTAADEVRFKATEILVNSSSTYDLIRSCVPAIRSPETMPVVDLDAVLLSIRRATQGNEIQLSVPVPNTSLTQELTLSIEDLVGSMPNARDLWQPQLQLTQDQLTLTINTCPLSLKHLFNTTRAVIRSQQAANQLSADSRDASEKLQEMDQQLKSMASVSVGTVVESIQSIELSTGETITSVADIRNFINNVDLAYFREIQQHLEQQKQKLRLQQRCESSEAQRAAGAPAHWMADIAFDFSNFFKK